jgi:cyclic nucleotide gated channel
VKDIILLLILLAFQVIVLAIIPNLKSTGPFLAKDLLKYTVLIQYVPRLLRIRPLFQEVTRTSGILAETAWAGAVFNLLLYMLASHVNIFNCILQIPLSCSICPSYHGRIF